MFKKKIDIGKTIAERVVDYPVFRKESKNNPPLWIVCPDFKINFPKRLTGKEQYEYTVSAFARDHKTASEMLNYLIRWGKKGIEAKGLRLWLHAVKHSVNHVKGRPLFRADIKYIFRIEEIQEEIPQEVN